MRFLKALFFACLGAGMLAAQSAVPSQIPSFDPSAMDTSADACTDFYQYACGGWIAKNPVPADQARWGRFNELAEKNRQILYSILEAASTEKPGRTALEQKYGDFYAACMDEKSINAKGTKALQPLLARIDNVNSKDDLAMVIAALRSQAGVGVLFRYGAGQDYKDASQVIAQLDQGGLGLPDRDYYTNTDSKSEEIRKQYVTHMTNMFRLLGDTPLQAGAEAHSVMEIETALANGSLTRVERRDPANTYHKISTAELATLAPSFRWNAYFDGTGTAIQSLNVESPNFLKTVDQEIQKVTLSEWKSYMRWHVLHSEAELLSDPFVQEDFNFYGKTLLGQKEEKPRWKRCVSFTDRELGEALAQAYVQQNFGADNKAQTVKLVAALEHALGEDIKSLPWMTEETKAQAEEKLQHIANKIGYPEHWRRDYSSVQITRKDLVADVMHADAFEFHRELNKIGKPVDRDEWFMTPPTVNAYYAQSMNDINFPAGILQQPFFDKNADEAMNYGGIGVVIGHELTHGFDDQGRKFDEKGNLRDWWTPADAQAFQQRADCLTNEYASFSPVPGVNLNGKLTLGENTADNGGLRLAYMALMDALAQNPEAAAQKIDGFTPEQRFFISFAQVWCENRTPEYSRQAAITDAHSPGKFRAIGAVKNNEAFSKAFGCKTGQPMYAENACRVW